ncbi:Mor transcription activator family protein [Burkholderia cenocepacia]|uniref:Mor transcription activator family protein n=1 Tax=Burkholderia cenocepacia TaxID=95486 RepID=UPI00209DFEDB|nr:Mor transcription activator family protein [Burkholderia cenocepacia]MCO8326827.1 DNA transposition protein [Burkholderia cenocepacia]MCO8333890.1 DNA transposition protein [Burkholderia cenocepacia]MCO8341263.1 DNA transposition protein [Burkholderia cenocepacia]MCO8348683.1 DNA transposition protein [Burkholderia cenocepacia]MCO8361875.1 DNA transposition protein [Burkholderia cenocepacia]
MNLKDVEHLLPRSAITLIAVIGLPATSQLVTKMAGVVFPIPKRKHRAGEARYEELAECVGPEAADRLCHHFGGETIEIPICKAALRELRDREIRTDFDKITAAFSARHAWSQLALKYHLTSRQIRRILDEPVKLERQVSQMELL